MSADTSVMDTPPPVERVDALRAMKDIAFGSIAGMVAKVFEHPFDLCKVRLQSQVLDTTARFNGPIDCLYKTWKYEGIRGLYRGLPPPILGAAAENATLFLSYNNLKRGLAAYDPSAVERAGGTPLLHTIIAAAGAGAVTSFVLTPIELVKCKMQVQMIAASPFPGATGAATTMPIKPSDLPGPIAILKSVIQVQGFRGLWLGHTGTLIRESGGGAAWFGIKETVSRFLLARRQSELDSLHPIPALPTPISEEPPTRVARPEVSLRPWESALSGACAGVGYTFLLFPADCVKSTIQTEEELRPRAASVPGQAAVPRSTFTSVFRDIYRTKGIPGLYAGAGVTGFRSAVSSGLMFLIYDALEKHFG